MSPPVGWAWLDDPTEECLGFLTKQNREPVPLKSCLRILLGATLTKYSFTLVILPKLQVLTRALVAPRISFGYCVVTRVGGGEITSKHFLLD